MSAAAPGPETEPGDGRANRLIDIPAIAQIVELGGARFFPWGQLPSGRKMPLRTNGRLGSSTDPTAWTSLAMAEAAVADLRDRKVWPAELAGIVIRGVGVALGKLPNGEWLVGLDPDLCRSPLTGKIEPWAQRIIDRLPTYPEISPSGTGVKLLGLAERLPPFLLEGGKPKGRDALRPPDAVIPDGAAGMSSHEAPGLGVFPAGRFFALTGLHLEGRPDWLGDITEPLAELAHEIARWSGGKADGSTEHGHHQSQDDDELVDPINGEIITAELVRRPECITPEIAAHIVNDDDFKAGWQTGRKLAKGSDESRSGIDWCMGIYLSRTDFPLAAIVSALWFNPWGEFAQGKYTKAADAERQVRKIIENVVRLRIKRRRAAEDEAKAEAAEAADQRPLLWVHPGQVKDGAHQCVAALNNAPFDQSVFQREPDPVVVRLVETVEELSVAAEHKATLPAGMAVLRKATPDHVLYAIERQLRAVKPGRRKKGDEGPVKPKPATADVPLQLARVVLRNGRFRAIKRVVRQPTLRADGSLLTTPGYDPASCLVYWPSEAFPEIPNRPGLAEAHAAVARLRRPFRAFPFVEEVDWAVTLSMLLTIKTRHLYARAPEFLGRAPEAGTGKTLLVDGVALLATGSMAANVSAAVLDDTSELRKLLTTWTMAGTAVGLFDNARRGSGITSPELCRFLTAGAANDRLLGGNDQMDSPVVTTVAITGNAVSIGDELVRRTLTVDLDANQENPHLRPVDFDLEEEIRRDRPELVAAALILLRAYIAAGRPVAKVAPFGSYEHWGRWARDPLIWAGLPDPCLTLAKHADTDEHRIAMGQLLALLYAVLGSGEFTSGEVMIAVTDGTNDEDENRREARFYLRDALLELVKKPKDKDCPSRADIGRTLLEHRNRIIDGYRLTAEHDNHKRHWRFRVRRVGKGT